MVCIYCGHDTEIYNSRPKARTPSVWRRRRCQVCVAQFTTIELPDYETAFVIRQHERGQLLPFKRDKLFLSLYKALGHRRTAMDDATHLTHTILGKLSRSQSVLDGILDTKAIATYAYHALKRFDILAAQTYKAYHQASLS